MHTSLVQSTLNRLKVVGHKKKSYIKNKGPSVDGQAMCTREMGEFLINKHLQIEKMCVEKRSEQLSNFKLFNHNS